MKHGFFYPAYIHSIGDNFYNGGSDENWTRIILAWQASTIAIRWQNHIKGFHKEGCPSPNLDSTKVFAYCEVIIASSINLDYHSLLSIMYTRVSYLSKHLSTVPIIYWLFYLDSWTRGHCFISNAKIIKLLN